VQHEDQTFTALLENIANFETIQIKLLAFFDRQNPMSTSIQKNYFSSKRRQNVSKKPSMVKEFKSLE
jgi:hypothetical protein